MPAVHARTARNDRLDGHVGSTRKRHTVTHSIDDTGNLMTGLYAGWISQCTMEDVKVRPTNPGGRDSEANQPANGSGMSRSTTPISPTP